MSDNTESVKGIERRLQSLYGILASPAREGDYAEGARRVELRRFVLVRYACQFAHPTLRKLDGVIAKLEPLSEQHALVKFLRNADNAKVVTGFVQELADAVQYYQVRAPSSVVIFNKNTARFHCNKECTRGQGTSTTIPRTFMMKPRASLLIQRISMVILRMSW